MFKKCRMVLFAILCFVAAMISACVGINIDAARTLAKTGRSVAVQAQQNIMVSDTEYLRARESEALLHGYSGTTQSPLYVQLLSSYDDIRQELAKRSVVFEKLADLYDAFGELAGLDAGAQTEKALGNLGGAIAEYAKQTNQPVSLSGNTTTAISKIGGFAAAEIQKIRIKEASIQIRGKVDTFRQLLENGLIREQIEGFRESLASSRKAAFIMLWDAGVYNPKPLLDEFGQVAGLVTQSNAAVTIKSNTRLANALKEVLDKRLAANQFTLIEKAYGVSIRALKSLVSEHRRLEQGDPLDLSHLQATVAELRGIVVLLEKAKNNVSASQ